MNMKLNNMKLNVLGAMIVLTFASLGAYAEESQEATNINKDQVEGRVEEAKGTVKEVTGKVLDDKGMEIEGNIQKNVGKAQAGFGDLKKDVEDIKQGK
jgi:uncharacterized protein YjbJ (UPF0337 family)